MKNLVPAVLLWSLVNVGCSPPPSQARGPDTSCAPGSGEGLTISAASEVDGLVGAFRKGERTVFFRARRGGVNAEWHFSAPGYTPKYDVAAQLLDRNCRGFFTQSGPRDGWRPAKTGVMSPEEVGAHRDDLRLTRELVLALRGAGLPPALAPELDALVAAPAF